MPPGGPFVFPIVLPPPIFHGWGPSPPVPPSPPFATDRSTATLQLPVIDSEVDILNFCVSDDCNGLTVELTLGGYPNIVGIPPHLQVAIDVVGTTNGLGTTWYDPNGVMTVAPWIGRNAVPQFDWEVLVSTNLTTPGLNPAFVHAPGFPVVAPPAIPSTWLPGPINSTVRFTIPWGPLFVKQPIGTVLGFTVMSAHGMMDLNLGPAGAPATEPDDVLTNAIGPLPNSTANELALDPFPFNGVDHQTTRTLAGCPLTTVSMATSLMPVLESVGNAMVEVNLSALSPVTVTVDYTTNDGTAVEPDDYADTFGQLIFPPGITQRFIPVPIVDDPWDELDETFRVTLSNPVGAFLGPDITTVVIRDNDDPPTISLTLAAQSVPEDGGWATMNVTLSSTSSLPITVDFSTFDISAVSPDDYTGTTGTLTFNPGDLLQSVQVWIVNDPLFEPDETFRFNLSNPINGLLGISDQIITILDDEDPSTCEVDPPGDTIGYLMPPGGPLTVPILIPPALAHGWGPNPPVPLFASDRSTLTLQLPVPDQEVDILSFCVSDDCNGLNFKITIGGFPSTIGIPPHLQIAVDEVGTTNGLGTRWYDPNGVMTVAPWVGQGTATPFDWEMLITTNLTTAGLQMGYVHPPGFGATAPIQMTWNPGPGISTLDFTVPWGTGIARPSVGEALGFTIMSAHGMNDPILGVVAAPATEPDDVITNAIGPLPNSTANELAFDPIPFNGVDHQTTHTLYGCPLTTVTMNTNALSVNENVGVAMVEVNLTSPSAVTVTVDYTSNDGTAFKPGDYTDTFGTLTFIPGDVQEFIPIPIIDDPWDEVDEFFTVSLANSVGAYMGPDLTTVVIRDNDNPPTISLSLAAQSVPEVIGNATVTVNLSTTSSFTVTVDYETLDVTAVNPDDYALTTGTLTFNPGQSTQNVSVPINSDLLNEANELFRFRLLNPVNGLLGLDIQEITILDDDATPTLSLTLGAQNVGESAGTVTVTATLSTTSGQTVTADYFTTDGTALSPADYNTISGQLNFPAGTTLLTRIVTINPDLLDEFDEDFFFRLINPTNAVFGLDIQTITILDDDAAPTVTMVQNVQAEGEAVGTANIMVQLSAASEKTITVDFTTANGSAVAPGDYTTTTGTLTFLPGQTLLPIPVPIAEDGINEGNENFTVRLVAPASNVSIGAQDTTTVTIVDNDGAPQIFLSMVSTTVLENIGNATVFVNLTTSSGLVISVDYLTTDVTALAPGDYTDTTGTLTFPPGTTQLPVPVPIISDFLDEFDEDFRFSVLNPTNAGIGAPSSLLITIQDDDAPPTISLSLAAQSVLENSGGATVTIQLSSPSEKVVQADYLTTDGTALAPGDYTTTTGNVSFAAGELVKTVFVPVINDLTDEFDETFLFRLLNSVNSALGLDLQTITILDEDAPPVVTMLDLTLSVGEAIGNANVQVQLSAASEKTIQVDYTTADGSAVAPGDYAITTGTLTFLPGQTMLPIPVPINEDFFNEANEDFTVQLVAPVSEVTIGAQDTTTVTILDNDAAPEFFLSMVSNSVLENIGNAIVFANLTSPSGQTVSVDFLTSDITAVAPADYGTTAGTLTFSPGTTQIPVPVSIVSDFLDEFDEDFLFRIFNAQFAALGTTNTLVITIQDDDLPPTSSLSTAAQSVLENIGNATVTIQLSAPSAKVVEADYFTTDGTALSPPDYTSTLGHVTFAPGEITKDIAVPIINDVIDEFDEDFYFRLISPINSTLGLDLQAVTILDDDAPPTVTFTVNTQNVDEFTTFAVVTVDLLTTSGKTVSVDYLTSDIAATNPGDYFATSGTLTFPPGVTSLTFSVQIVDDPLDEPNEDFLVTLLNPVNASLGISQNIVVIVDDDPPPFVFFVAATQTVNELDGTFSIEVALSAPSSFTITVDFFDTGVSALEPGDYVMAPGQITFLPGETLQTISGTLTDDPIHEPNETFLVDLINAVNALPGVTIQHTVVIEDDDPPPGPYGNREVVVSYAGEGRNPGQFGRLIHDALGNIHVVYYEADRGDLKYAKGTINPLTGSVTWKVQVVDSVGNVGHYCDIATDGLNNPLISYYDVTNKKLKVAWDQNGDGDFEQNGVVFGRNDVTFFFEIVTVDDSTADVGKWSSIGVDALGIFHLVYKDEINDTLRYAYRSGIAWNYSTINTAPQSPEAGGYVSLEVESKTLGPFGVIKLFVAYHDEVDHDLEMVLHDPLIQPGWTNFGSLDQSGDTGLHISTALDPVIPNRVYISYQDALTGNPTLAALRFLVFDEFGPVLPETVASCTPIFGDICPAGQLNGNWGYYSSVAVNGAGLPVVAHYDNVFGDLLFERRMTNIPGPQVPLTDTWFNKRRPDTTGNIGKFTSSGHSTFTDASAVTTDLIRTSFYDTSHAALRMTTVANDMIATNSAAYIDGAKVGEYSALDLDAAERAWIAYYDNPKGSLYMTRRVGPDSALWETPFLVDDSAASRARPGDTFIIENNDFTISRADFSQTGPFVSMVVDPSNVAHLAYYDELRRELNVSVVDYSTSTSQRIAVDEGRERGMFASIAANSAYTQYAIAYYQAFDDSGDPLDAIGNGPRLRVAIGDGMTSGTWSVESVDNVGDVGRYCSIVYGPGGRIHVAYYDATNFNLKYAVRNAGVWTTSVVDGTANIAGLHTSIAINPDTNHPNIAYYDLTNSALMLAEFDGIAWTRSTVDATGDTGLYPDLKFDTVRDVVYIIYHDASFESARIAIKPIASPGWTKLDTIETGGVGVRPSIAIDSAGLLRMCYYDQRRGDLIYRQSLSPPLSSVDGSWSLYD